MEFSIKSGNPEKQRTACVIVGISETRRLSAAAKAIDNVSKKYISNLIRRGDIEGKKGQMLLLHNVPGMIADRVLLIGCGREREMNDREFRKIIAHSIKCLYQTGSMEAVSYLTDLNIKGRDHNWKIKQSVLVTRNTLYKFDELKTKKKTTRRPLRKITFIVPTRRELPLGEHSMNEGKAIANGIKLTRDLANRPANICTPSYLANQAKQLASTCKSIQVKVLGETEMKKLGMGSLLSVAQGTREPAKLITIEYKGGKRNSKPIVLVGKGVTFDTGGISTLSAAAELALPLNITGVIPATENMPDGSATKPGDIFTSLSGQTIEVLNTDAEGRLILCDALTYCERFNPDIVIDIATLTGACVIALGGHASGLMSNNNSLAKDLLNAGETIGDRAWQLPLWDEYQQQLNSPFADMANIGGRDAGTITAACFLSRFTSKFEWAHLDIAGTAWTTGKNKCATDKSNQS
jgi:leucyl aminopeptidase